MEQLLSHYRIIKKLGAGGMGEVYLAEDSQLRRKVAIKMLPVAAESDGQARKRLLRETQTAATLDHSHICSIYEIGEANERSFIVMQYVEGETLADVLNRSRLSVHDSLKLADLPTVQREIALEVSEKLRLRLTGAEKQRLTTHYTDNAEAYRLYLKGRYFWDKRTREGIENAIKNYNDAIALDPTGCAA